jgi:Fe-S cluster assembly scaffold protein SufB
LKDTFKEVAEKTIPKKKKKNGPTWMSQDTLRVVEIKQQMNMEGNWAKVRKLNGEIQKRIRKDKENYLKEKGKVLEEHNKNARCWKSTIKRQGVGRAQ